jgi:glucose/arabinose dehydrogenase
MEEMDGRLTSNEDFIFLTGTNAILSSYTIQPHPERLYKEKDCTSNYSNLNICIEHHNLFNHVISISKKTLESLKISTGHRRSEGLLWDSHRKILWETEHGPRGGDELNNIIQDRNYGWPYVTLGRWYTMEMKNRPSKLEPKTKYNTHENFELPVFSWLPSIGISQLTLINSESFFKDWMNDLIVSSLKDQSLHRLKLTDDNHILYEERIEIGYRIRDIEATNSTIFLSTDDGKIITINKSKKKNISENEFPLIKWNPQHK